MFLRVCRAFRKTAGLQQLWNPAVCKLYATESPNELTNGERKLLAILRKRFPKSKQVEVADISGGCGAMYEILIEADEFHGKNTLAQHRMVNEALSDEIKDMHGLRIVTKIPHQSRP